MRKLKDILVMAITDFFTLMLAILMVTILCMVIVPSLGNAETILNFKSGTAVPDVNKDWVLDTNMCWAATAANMLAMAVNRYEGDAYFKLLQEHFPNEGGQTYNGILKLLELNDVTKETANLFISRTDSASTHLPNWIKGALLQEEAVGIAIYPPDEMKNPTGHTLTVYGYEEKDGITSLIFADSDDRLSQLSIVPFTYDGTNMVFNEGPLKGYTIEHAISLVIMRKD